MRIGSLFSIGAILAALVAAAPARAALLQYDLTGAYNASWTIDTSIAPSLYFPDSQLTYTGLTGLFPDPNDLSIIYTIAEICFYSVNGGTGFEIDENGNNQNHYVGVSGDDTIPGNRLAQFDDQFGTAAPMLLTGEFDLVRYDFDSGENDYGTTYHLSVRTLPAAVPEPQSWALMIAGFGLIGGVARRRRSVPRLAFA